MKLEISNYIPVVLRYVLGWLGAALVTRGYIDGEQGAIFSQNVDVIVGALVALGSVAYAIWKRPSNKALDAAKAIDKRLPADEPVVIQTPEGVPDIVVQPK